MKNEWYSKTLRFYRRGLGLSQLDLAKKIGVSKNCISAIETGNWIPSTKTHYAILDAFNEREAGKGSAFHWDLVNSFERRFNER